MFILTEDDEIPEGSYSANTIIPVLGSFYVILKGIGLLFCEGIVIWKFELFSMLIML